MPDTARRFYRPAEIAALTGLSKGAVYHAIRTGKLPALRLRDETRDSLDRRNPGAIMIPAAALKQFLDAATPVREPAQPSRAPLDLLDRARRVAAHLDFDQLARVVEAAEDRARREADA